MKSFYQGEIKFQLDSPFYEILEATIHLFFEKQMQLTKNKLIVKAFASNLYQSIEDFIFFIKKYGKLLEVDICYPYFTNERTFVFYYLRSDLLRKNLIYFEENVYKKYDSVTDFRSDFKDEVFSSYAVDPNCLSIRENLQAFITSKDEAALQSCVTDVSYFYLFSLNYCIFFNGGEVLVFQIHGEIDTEIKETSNLQLSACEINPNERRKIVTHGLEFPFLEVFMKWIPEKEKPIVKVADGSFQSICSQCKHRIDKEIYGSVCRPCKPEMTNKGV